MKKFKTWIEEGLDRADISQKKTKLPKHSKDPKLKGKVDPKIADKGIPREDMSNKKTKLPSYKKNPDPGKVQADPDTGKVKRGDIQEKAENRSDKDQEKHFKKTLKKDHGADEITDLDKDEKKKFFNKIDKTSKADDAEKDKNESFSLSDIIENKLTEEFAKTPSEIKSMLKKMIDAKKDDGVFGGKSALTN